MSIIDVGKIEYQNASGCGLIMQQINVGNLYFGIGRDEKCHNYRYQIYQLLTTASDNARVRFENNICRDSKRNPITFWQYVNSKH